MSISNAAYSALIESHADLTVKNAELLEALEGLAACISETRGLPAHEALAKARAAIAKARGEK